MKRFLFVIALFFVTAVIINACKHEPVQTDINTAPIPGPVPNNGVCFESDILPLFQTNCAKSNCHDALSHQDGYILDSYANIVKKGIVPGKANSSKIYEVLFKTGSDKMPPLPNADLSSDQKNLIGKWINEGAKNTTSCGSSCDSNLFKYAANISVIMNTYCVGCHGGATPSANVNLSFYNGVRQQAINGRLVGAVSHAPGYSAMPKGSNKLSECQIAQIRKWVNAGALNN